MFDILVKYIFALQKRRVGQGIQSMWFNGKVREKFNRKQRLFRDLKKHCAAESVAEYKPSRRELKKEIRLAKKGVESMVANNLKQDTKSFYKYICRKSNFWDKIGPLFDATGQLESRDREMADMFNRYFVSVFSTKSAFDIGGRSRGYWAIHCGCQY